MFHSKEISFLPDLLALHQFKPDVYPYLLASNTQGQQNTRYSILMAYPEQTHVQGLHDDDCLQHISTDVCANPVHSELPFIGGWFVFLSYEYAACIEPGVPFHQGNSELPVALISRIPAAVIIDHEQQKTILVSTDQRSELIQDMEQDIEQAQADSVSFNGLPGFSIDEEDADIYLEQLQKIQHYIHEGDIFQANLSRLWQVEFEKDCSASDLYHQLSLSNPSPFAALVKLGEQYIISSSPERLISVENGIIETRPIAGTHPRGKDESQDLELQKNLIAHPKERAEHVMLIDLERNDLGRVCQPGSIRVQDKMVVETYQYVHHLVSSIQGKLQPHTSVQQIIHAVFPGGTITGCPKVRCMEIICELEHQARGAYTGSLGYISDHGNIDLNILIRTMTLKGRHLEFRAGAGIVSDSIAQKELQETRHKAEGLINALQAH